MNRILFLTAFLGVFLFSSCVMRKVEYVKNMSPDSIYHIKAERLLKIQPNDRLSITVLSKNMELAAPFNTNLGGVRLVTDTEIVKKVNTEEKFEEGYLVDKEGFIDFPILGKLKVAGLTIEELRAYVSNEIKRRKYIDDALVKVNLLNFRIMTMGEIDNKIIEIPNGKVTVLEAVVQSGGLTLNSDGTKVKVFREQNGERKMFVVNLEEYNMFNSEAYYLQQNDIVYVPQKDKDMTPGTRSTWQMISMFFGAISLVVSVISLTKK